MAARGRQNLGVEIDHLIDHAERLLTLFDLSEQADQLIAGYSTGQQQKIALAGALVTEAPIMLLDEPFSGGLDPSGIRALRRVLQHRAQGDHYTIVFATPVPELVEELADKVAILKDGQITAFGTVDQLKHQTGRDGHLDEVYEALVDPKTAVNVENYLRGEKL